MESSNEKIVDVSRMKKKKAPNIRWLLVGYDLVVYAVVAAILLVLYGGMDKLSPIGVFQQICLSIPCIFIARLLGKIYRQVWRYGGIQCYIRLLFTDSTAFVVYLFLELLLPVKENNKFEKIGSKIWLSSPSMHGPEIEYVKEVYEMPKDT